MRENRKLGNNRRMGGQGLVQTEIPSHIRQERVSFQTPSQKVVSSSNEVSNVDTENYVSGIVGVRTHYNRELGALKYISKGIENPR